MLLAPCSYFTQTHNRHNGILVSRVGSCQAAVAFLQAEYVVVGAGLLEQLDLFPDKFKACENFNQFYVVIRRNGVCHISGNDGFHHSRVGGHGPCGGAFPQDVFRNEHAGHVSCKRHIFTALCIQRINAQTVGIRIGCHHDIRIFFLSKLQRQRKCLGIFRIGIIQRGKFGIRKLLLRNHIYMLEAQLGKHSSDRLVARAVEGGVYNLDIISHFLNHFGMDDLFFQLYHISIVDFGADYLVKPCCRGGILIHGLHIGIIGNRLHLIDDFLILGRGHLGAVLPVYLIAVIFRRVMACRYHDSGDATQGAQRKGKLWCGP